MNDDGVFMTSISTDSWGFFALEFDGELIDWYPGSPLPVYTPETVLEGEDD